MRDGEIELAECLECQDVIVLQCEFDEFLGFDMFVFCVCVYGVHE